MIDLQKVFQEMKVEPADKIADFGCGSGFMVLEFAKQTGEFGQVFAIDIQEEPLEVVETRAKAQKLFNIKTIKSDLEKENGSTLSANLCHWVVIANVLFQIENPEPVIKEAFRILKQGGKVITIDWHPEKMIDQNSHFAKGLEEMKSFFEKQSFKFVKEFSPGPGHFAIIFQK